MLIYSGHTGQGLGEFKAQILKLFKRFNLRFLVTPDLTKRVFKSPIVTTEFGYACDNGAWSAFVNKRPFDFDQFYVMVEEIHSCADFIVIPDVVWNAKATLQLAEEHIKELRSMTDTQLCVCWQDGMKIEEVLDFIKDGIGIFVGGTDAEKYKSTPALARICDHYNVPCHIGRVNSVTRARWAKRNGVSSIDGTGFILFPTQFNIPYVLEADEAQLSLFPQKKAKTFIKSKSARMDFFNINQEEINDFFTQLNKVETNGVGYKESRKKENYPFLWWD